MSAGLTCPGRFGRTRDEILKGRPHRMRPMNLLALLPTLGMLFGPFFFNHVEPYVLGMPFLLAWLVGCTLATAAVMAVIYLTDPENRDGKAE